MVRLVGVEPTTGKSPADFKPAAYANFATAAPAANAAKSVYHADSGGAPSASSNRIRHYLPGFVV